MAKSIRRVRSSGPKRTGAVGAKGSGTRAEASSATARVEPAWLTSTGLADCAAPRRAGVESAAQQASATAANSSARFAHEVLEAFIVRG